MRWRCRPRFLGAAKAEDVSSSGLSGWVRLFSHLWNLCVIPEATYERSTTSRPVYEAQPICKCGVDAAVSRRSLHRWVAIVDVDCVDPPSQPAVQIPLLIHNTLFIHNKWSIALACCSMHKIILLLASDSLIRKSLRAALESAGCSVLSAENIDQAERLIGDFKPDLIMVRPYTENMSGYDAAILLRRRRPGIPVLIVAGIPEDIALEDRAAIGRLEIFPKPFKTSELLDKLKEMLGELSPQPDQGASK